MQFLPVRGYSKNSNIDANSTRSRAIILSLVLLVVFIRVYGSAEVDLNQYYSTLYSDGSTQKLTACVAGLEERKSLANRSYSMLKMANVSLEDGTRLQGIRLYSDQALGWRYGQCWQFFAELRQPNSLNNPGGFNYAAWLNRQGVDALVSLDLQQPVLKVAESSHLFGDLRIALAQAIRSNDFRGKPYIAALLIADRSGFSSMDWQVLKKTGLIHLFAISGLHIGLIASVSFLVFRGILILFLWLIPCLSIRLWALAFSLIPAAIYVFLAGAGIPAVRAFLMVSLVITALLLRRRSNSLMVLLMIACGFILVSPQRLFDASFQLSFLAVFAVLFHLNNRSESGGALKQLMVLQYYLLIILSPFLVYWGGGLSLSALLLNLILIPVFAVLVMPLLLLTLLSFHFQQGLSVSLWGFLGAAIEKLLWALEDAVFLDPSFIQFSNHYLPVSLLALAVSLFVVFSALRQFPKSYFLFVFYLVAWFLPYSRPSWGEFKLTVFDVGQGSAALLETHRQQWVIDVGPSWVSGSDAGERVITPFLQWRGHRSISGVILSHYDKDHAGGLEGLLSFFSPKELLAPNGSDYESIFDSCYAGQSWWLEGVKLQVLHPSSLQSYKGNNSSCVIKVSNTNFSVLLPGDIEKKAEFPLAATDRARLESDVLLAPHHGSSSSSSWAFLSAVDPSWVIVSAGKNNQFRHPHQDIMKRYQLLGIKTIQTSESGAILLDSQTATVKPWR